MRSGRGWCCGLGRALGVVWEGESWRVGLVGEEFWEEGGVADFPVNLEVQLDLEYFSHSQGLDQIQFYHLYRLYHRPLLQTQLANHVQNLLLASLVSAEVPLVEAALTAT